MAYDRAVTLNDVAYGGGTLSAAVSGGQFLKAGSNTLAAFGSGTKSFNYTELDVSPGGSGTAIPVGYALGNAASGTSIGYLRNGLIIAPAAATIAANDLVQVEGEETFRAVVKAVTGSAVIGTALNTATSGLGVVVALRL